MVAMEWTPWHKEKNVHYQERYKKIPTLQISRALLELSPTDLSKLGEGTYARITSIM